MQIDPTMRRGLHLRPLAVNAPTLYGHALMAQRAPDTLMRPGVTFSPGLYGNDVHSDCTDAAVANAARSEMMVNHGTDLAITTDQVLAMFTRQGWNPADPATDTGRYMDDVLNDQLANGFDIGQEAPLAGLWAGIDPADFNGLRMVMATVGAAALSLNLAEADVNCGDLPWTTSLPASCGDPTPGTAGGHEVVACLYSGIGLDDLVTIQTWGGLHLASWGWLRSRMTQSFMVMFRVALGMGIDTERLAADCSAQLGAVG